MKKLQVFLLLSLSIIVLASCDKSDDGIGELGGSQSPIGEVGNSFSISSVSGISNPTAVVSSINSGVSTVTCSGRITNSTYLGIVQSVTDEMIAGSLATSGDNVSADLKVKFTSNGAQSIYDDGTVCTLVKYDAKVGDVYTAKLGSNTLRREVTSVSSEDDFSWGGMYIKVIEVKNTSMVPGVSDVTSYYNHKFGLVGMNIHFEDGSEKHITITSLKY